MKTEDIMNLDCRDERNKERLFKFIFQVKPAQKILRERNCKTAKDVMTAPVDMFESVIFELFKYGYKINHIIPVIENNKFAVWSCTISDNNNSLIGFVYGLTIKEVLIKTVIRIYGDIKKKERK